MSGPSCATRGHLWGAMEKCVMCGAARPLNPWQPMSAPIDLKHMGKLGEELGEASAAVSRCIIQGIDEREPVTGKPNREWLEDEIADVLANFDLVVSHFVLDTDRIAARVKYKVGHLAKWHAMLEPRQ